MMTAAQYGNSGAYFANNANDQTSYMLGLSGAFGGKRPVSVYSVVRQGGTAISVPARIGAASAAIIGRVGMRLVAFPLVTGWNFDTPET